MTAQIKNVDDVIVHLTQNREKRPNAPIPPLDPQIVTHICHRVREIFARESTLLNVSAPVTVCGDIHGQFSDLLRIFEFCGYPNKTRYLFLGDYVDRGKQSLETIVLLFCFKIKYPNDVFLLRGNHEDASLNRIYGFYDECKRKYSVKMWKTFVEVFNWMPIAALIERRILCMHGGLSPELYELSQINNIQRPLEIPDEGIVCDLLWSDPEKGIAGWKPNDRGVSYIFGADVVRKFVEKNDLDLICRAHQVVEDGYEFFAGKRLVTIFSAPNYDGAFTNNAAMLVVAPDLTCSFAVLKNK